MVMAAMAAIVMVVAAVVVIRRRIIVDWETVRAEAVVPYGQVLSLAEAKVWFTVLHRIEEWCRWV